MVICSDELTKLQEIQLHISLKIQKEKSQSEKIDKDLKVNFNIVY